MEIYSFKDLLQRISEIQIRGSDISSVGVFNDYISTNSIMKLIKHQKEIENIRVAKEDFFTGEETTNQVSITRNIDNTTFFIMAEKKISFSAPYRRFWFGKKTEEFTDYLYCYPQNHRQTTLIRNDEDGTTTIDIHESTSKKLGCIVRVNRYDTKTKEYRKLDEKSIGETAMKIFDNAVVSMNIFGDIARGYQAQQQDGSR